jgi:hypothetical protein
MAAELLPISSFSLNSEELLYKYEMIFEKYLETGGLNNLRIL